VIKTDNQIENQKIAYAIFIVLLGVSSVGFNIFTITKYSSSAILGMCFFTLFVVVCFLKGGYKYSHSKLLLLLASILFPVFVTLENNLVMNRHSNSVENMLTSIFSIAFLIYILYEGKRVFSGEHSPWHFASMMLLAHTGLTLSVSYCIAYLLGSVNETSRLYQIVLIFAMSSFVEFELIRFVRNAKSHTKEEWDEIENPKEEIIQ
jgi:predicted Na+-dependent transporter